MPMTIEEADKKVTSPRNKMSEANKSSQVFKRLNKKNLNSKNNFYEILICLKYVGFIEIF